MRKSVCYGLEEANNVVELGEGGKKEGRKKGGFGDFRSAAR